jgi:acyl dehydratase
MPEVDLNVIGQKTDERVFEYDFTDVVLYHLGVGASEKDLALVYEDAPGGLKVLPSFCVAPAIRAFPYLGDDLEWSLMLHGEQTIRLYRPIPPAGKLTQVGECTNIFDKGKGALYQIKVEGKTEEGERLYEAEWAIFYVGAGGFGGDPGPKAARVEPPAGVAPDFSVTDKVADNQAAIYRLSGDLNPLHLDPEAAKRGGFDKPILHGLCTYGFATRAIVSGPLAGDVERLKEFKARFSDPVYPGDTLTTQGWKVAGGYIIQVKAEERVVLTHAMAVVEGM